MKDLNGRSKLVRPTGVEPAMVGVSRNTVQRYLQRVAPELEALPNFRDRIGDTLALNLARCMDLEDKLLIALNDEETLSQLTATEKKRLLGRVTIAKGVTFDKLRLHEAEGKSTVNSSHRLQLEMAHEHLFDKPASDGK